MPKALDPEERKFYVYIFFNANGRPLYVGRGHGSRWTHHLRMSEKSKKHSNAYLRRAMVAADGNLPCVKIQENLTNTEANDVEVALIKAIGRGRLGPLVNLTDGGEGWVGLVKTEEHKKAIGLAHKGRKLTAEQRQAMLERAGAPETRRKHSEAADRYHANMTPEEKAERAQKISKATKAAMTPEVCAKISANRVGQTRLPTKGNTGKKWTEARREKARVAIEARKVVGWHSAETAAKISDAHTKRREAGISGTSRSSRWRQRVREQRAYDAVATVASRD